MRTTFCAILLAALIGCSGKAIKESEIPTLQGVGIRSFSFLDKTRNRNLITKVWYPTEANEGTRLSFIFDSGAIEGAAWPAAREKLPVVFLSHGSGGYAETLSWLASLLASHGFLVIAPNHPGDTFGNTNPNGIFRKWERARDITYIIDHLDSVPELAGRADKARMGIAGFSMGGYAALALGGVGFDRKSYESYCASHASPDCRLFDGVNRAKLDSKGEQVNLADSRLRAVLALAPFGGPGAVVGKQNGVAIYIAGTLDDEILPFEKNARHYSNLIPQSRFKEFPKGGHYAMVGPCTEKGKLFASEICADRFGVDRAKIQGELGPEVLAFFRDSLGGKKCALGAISSISDSSPRHCLGRASASESSLQ